MPATASRSGGAKFLRLPDLYSPALQAVGYWLFIAGFLSTSVATVLVHETFVRAGCMVLLTSVAVFVVNIGKVLAHLIRPRIEPLILKPALPGKHMTAAMIDEAIIRETLRQVVDPELDCNIVDLGLVYGIAITAPKSS